MAVHFDDYIKDIREEAAERKAARKKQADSSTVAPVKTDAGQNYVHSNSVQS